MTGKYTYSFDRELYMGAFGSREEALAAALEKARTMESEPTTVYIGQFAPVDPRASGHAQAIINSISRRVRGELGEMGENVLGDVTREQVKELDESIAAMITGWLTKHGLIQRFRRIGAISEHTVPTSPQVISPKSSEVQEIGVGDFPVDSSTN